MGEQARPGQLMAGMEEHMLPGGRVTGVVRVGNTVRRPVSSDASLARAGELTRELHDLTAGTALAGESEVVCHNDLWPGNIVYRDVGQGLQPVAFIDWDLASPGERIHDVARLCRQYAGWWETNDPAEVARRSRVICDGYGLADRSDLVETVLWWQNRCWRGIDQAADAGDSAMVRLRASGAVEQVKAAYAWVEQHRKELHVQLGRGGETLEKGLPGERRRS